MSNYDAQVLCDYARFCRTTGEIAAAAGKESVVYEAMARSAEHTASLLEEHGVTMAELADHGEG